MSLTTRPLITTSMALAIFRATVPGRIIRRMASAGFHESDRIGLHIDRVNGCGYRRRVGPGCRASRGDGRRITTVDGRIFRGLDGPGYPASARLAGDMVIEITIGDLRWFTSSIAPLLAATMLDGTRSRRANAGTDRITGEDDDRARLPFRIASRRLAQTGRREVLEFILLNSRITE